MSDIRILVVDDYESWRIRTRMLLQARPQWRVICEVSDGFEAVQKAGELRPDVILLDIGLPKLNGIEAARQIRQLSPNSKLLFVSMENSPDVVQVAMNTGSQGYVFKASAQSDLLPAIDAVLRGEQFVSSTLEGYQLPDIPEQNTPHRHMYPCVPGQIDPSFPVQTQGERQHSYFESQEMKSIYSVFAHQDDGTVLLLATCNDAEQAVKIVKTLNESWPRKYEVKDSIGVIVYVNERSPI